MFIALFEPDIPQNTGSLVRLCACMGVGLHIIGPCGFPLDDKRLKRVAMDYYELAGIVRHDSWQDLLNFSRLQADARIILLTTKAAQAYTDFAYRPGDMLLLGRESAGVPESVRSVADAEVKIPVRPGTRSLNVALAASMVLGEGLRQTKGFL